MTWPRAINLSDGKSQWTGEADAIARPLTLAAAYDECHRTMRHHAHAFSFAARFVPAPKRRAIWAIYALLRYSDDLVDRAPATASRADLLATIDHWQAQVQANDPCLPILRAFADTRTRFAVPLEPLWDLFDGMRMDLTHARYASWPELERYCYCVAAAALPCRSPVPN